MNFIDPSLASGHIFRLERTDPRHFDLNGGQGPVGEMPKESFQSLLSEALHGVNADQIKSEDLMQKMIVDPDSVDIHDVTIAMAEAQMSLGIAKAVIDRAVTAYKEIINIR